MTLDEAIAIIDTALRPVKLSDLQESIFRYAWAGITYPEIATEMGYDPDYLRWAGAQLWQSLSNALGTKVTKTNFRSVLRNYATDKDNDSKQKAAPYQVVKHAPTQPFQVALELPEGPVSLGSQFYIERSPWEARCYDEITKPGALVSMRAPSLMGKTSLKHRLVAYATAQGYHTIRLNFEQIDEACLTNLNLLLRWFCAAISQQLRLEPKLDAYWNSDFGAKVSATVYMQDYVLGQIDRPVLLALDEVNRLFQYAEIAQRFLSLLRSWYEEARDLEVWQRLRLLVIHSTEFYVPLDINQSPFNVGLAIRLPEFSAAQVHELALRHGLSWTATEAQALIAMVGGHPYRVRLALYHLAQQELDLEQLLRDAPTSAGIYRHRLHHHWNTLKNYPDLKTAMQQVVLANHPVQIDPILAYQLESMGIIRLQREGAIPSCEVYRTYFQTQYSI